MAPFSAWKSRMQEMAENHKEQMETWKKEHEEHEKWQEDAWTLLEEWLKDDSPSSSLNLEGWKSEGPMIHLSSRVTRGNSTEERVGKVPVSTLVPLLRHLA